MKALYLVNLFAACFFLSFPSTAQTYEGLIDLTGYKKQVYYSPGHEARARVIAARFEKASSYLEKLLNFKPNTSLFILGQNEWAKYGNFPVYGMAHYPDPTRLVIAAEDNDFFRSFLPPLDKLPPALAANVKKAYTDKEGKLSMMPFFDLLALHELGHGFHEQAKLNTQRFWLQELFANMMLHTYIAENEPHQLLALEIFPEMVVAAGASEYENTTLEKFEKLYDSMDPKNYGWYQSRLHVAAKNIYNAGGRKVLVRLWKALRRTNDKLDDQMLATLLRRKVHPAVADVLLKW